MGEQIVIVLGSFANKLQEHQTYAYALKTCVMWIRAGTNWNRTRPVLDQFLSVLGLCGNKL
jgi:hypothetical protein